MNALANSQVEELKKFLEYGFPTDGAAVTFARYTGQEGPDERRRILAQPPDILLTNYVMLDLVLTRPDERQHLVSAARGLRFLVLDELHTYRGRQGADVAMLVRRVRDVCESPGLQVVGTSATMTTAGTRAQRKAVVADVATRLFGTAVTPGNVIGETLVRATTAAPTAAAALERRVIAVAAGDSPSEDFPTLAADPLAGWVESVFGLATDPEDAGSDGGGLIRGAPMRVSDAAGDLAALTGVTRATAASALENMLMAGSRTRDPVTGRPLFAFRLHQFISKGDNVYASLEAEADRHLTSHYQLRVPDHRVRRQQPRSGPFNAGGWIMI